MSHWLPNLRGVNGRLERTLATVLASAINPLVAAAVALAAERRAARAASLVVISPRISLVASPTFAASSLRVWCRSSLDGSFADTVADANMALVALVNAI